jgi:hypothetical protein
MAKHKYAGKTVSDILQGKRASIKDAELEQGSPSWDDIRDLTWEEVVARAKKREPGFKTIKKLLSKGEYDR